MFTGGSLGNVDFINHRYFLFAIGCLLLSLLTLSAKLIDLTLIVK